MLARLAHVQQGGIPSWVETRGSSAAHRRDAIFAVSAVRAEQLQLMRLEGGSE